MSASKRYELLCDAPGCGATCNVGEAQVAPTRSRAAQLGWTSRTLPPGPGHQWSWMVDLCPEHAGIDPAAPVPDAGDPLPAVCVDEVWLPVEVMREVRDCLAERVRWFESRGRAVPAATREAASVVSDAIDWAAGDPSKHERRLGR